MSATYVIRHPPPSVNNVFTSVPGRGRVKTQRYRTWVTAAGWDIKAARQNWRPESWYALDIRLPMAIAAKGTRADIDNRIKAVTDLLVSLDCVPDDKWLAQVAIRYGDVEHTTVTVTDAAWMEAA